MKIKIVKCKNENVRGTVRHPREKKKQEDTKTLPDTNNVILGKRKKNIIQANF